MLDISQIQSKEMKKEDFDICEVMRIALLSMEQKINDRGLDVETNIPDDPTMVQGDRDLITQVIYNLLENAALHGGRVKNITLTARRRNDKAELRVEDDGVGLDSHGLENVFDGMRTRAEQTSSDRRNMGIGLSVCMSIVQAHGGTMRAENRKKGGALLQFTLPLEEISHEYQREGSSN